jgi:hypothetical protein
MTWTFLKPQKRSISFTCLFTAFIIFFVIRSIRCWRNTIHWNLISSLIMQTIAWFMLNSFITSRKDEWSYLFAVTSGVVYAVNVFWTSSTVNLISRFFISTWLVYLKSDNCKKISKIFQKILKLFKVFKLGKCFLLLRENSW